MCGIAGWATATSQRARGARAARDARCDAPPRPRRRRRRRLQCRGRRLSRGARPPAARDHRSAGLAPADARRPAGLALTFNGEIYNFRELRGELEADGYAFERDSDTEVLLRAYQHWGKDVREAPARRVRLRDLGRAQGAPAPRARPLRREAALPARGAAARSISPPRSRRCSRAGREARGRLRRGRDYLAYRYVPGAAHAVRRHPQARRRRPTRSGRTAACARRATGRPPDGAGSDRGAARRTASRSSGFIERLDEAVQLQMEGHAPAGVLSPAASIRRRSWRCMKRQRAGGDLLRRLRRRQAERAAPPRRASRSTSAPSTTRSCCSARRAREPAAARGEPRRAGLRGRRTWRSTSSRARRRAT